MVLSLNTNHNKKTSPSHHQLRETRSNETQLGWSNPCLHIPTIYISFGNFSACLTENRSNSTMTSLTVRVSLEHTAYGIQSFLSWPSRVWKGNSLLEIWAITWYIYPKVCNLSSYLLCFSSTCSDEMILSILRAGSPTYGAQNSPSQQISTTLQYGSTNELSLLSFVYLTWASLDQRWG